MTGAGPLVARYWIANGNAHKMKPGDIAPMACAVAVHAADYDAEHERAAAKLEAIVRAADMLRREIEFAPCRDNEDHSRCLRCAAINAYDPVREEL